MRKTEVPGIYKESEGVLVNVDNEALMKYRRKRQIHQQKEDRINTLEEKMDSLSEDLKEIKDFLKELVNR